MAATQRLELRQRQSLVMTPQLQQAIKLLQLSNLELAAEVDRELEQNPLLDRDDGANDSLLDGPSPDQRDDSLDAGAETGAESGPELGGDAGADFDSADGPGDPDVLQQSTAEQLPSASDEPLDTDYDNVYTGSASWEGPGAEPAFSSRGGAGQGEDGDFSLEQRLSDSVTLRQHLSDQLQLEISDATERAIGAALIDQLDDNGYLSGDLGELAGQLGCPAERLEAVLAVLQGFEPTGIFARSLAECLALQLKERDRYDPAMQALVENLDLLAKGDHAKLRKTCGVDQEDLADMIAEIKALDPRPALSFEGEVAQPVVPDVLMRPDRQGGWIVELNSETVPRVLVNSDYYAQISNAVRSKKEREYLSERLQSANWLVKALHQRATTILKVATEIVRQQDAFFRKGVEHMKPLTLRDIATEIEMHESTVSRATANKFVMLPNQKVIPYSDFFRPSLSTKDVIKEIIERQEADGKSITDREICDLLLDQGIRIARRTVAKYRSELGILPSTMR